MDLCNRIYRSGILLGEDTDTVDIERACKKSRIAGSLLGLQHCRGISAVHLWLAPHGFFNNSGASNLILHLSLES